MHVCTCEMHVCTCEIHVCTCEVHVCTCEMRVCTCEMHVCTCEVHVCTCEVHVCTCEIHDYLRIGLVPGNGQCNTLHQKVYKLVANLSQKLGWLDCMNISLYNTRFANPEIREDTDSRLTVKLTQ